jgi:hypothetical protein
LTPAHKPDGAGKPEVNSAVVIRVTTPTLTTLDVEYETYAHHEFPLSQIPSGPGQPEPSYVAPKGQVKVTMTDDGTRRTWSLQFRVNGCSDIDRVNIYNVGKNGIKYPTPLHVYLVRDAGDDACSGGDAGSTFGWRATNSSGGTTPSATMVAPAATCNCTKTGAFVPPVETHGIAGADPTGNFVSPAGTFSVHAMSMGQQAQLLVEWQKGLMQTVPVLNQTQVAAWGLSPNKEFFVVVGPPLGAGGGAPISVYRVATSGFQKLLATTVYGDGYWGFSPDGSQFVVTRSYNSQSGNSTSLQFNFEDYDLVGPHPSIPAALGGEGGKQGPSLAFSPCGNLLLYFRWNQPSPAQGVADFYTVRGPATPKVSALTTGTSAPTASIKTATGPLDFVVAAEGQRSPKMSSNQCTAP